MRPLILKMNAFGPYADIQTIEFAELKGRRFFLIHGPTGAGKTTILDALCFSLYGDASNEHRDSKSLRSDHANAAVCTEVTFDFAVGQDMYRVQRIPEQERLKRRGEGTTVKAAEASFWKLAADGTTTLVTTGWGKVTERIEGILGFKSSQFRQVVLLPQGEFRKLLLADSKERQEIMQALFKTDLYWAVEDMLKTKAQGLKQQFEEINKECSWILQEASVQTVGELLERQEKSREQLAETAQQVAQQANLLLQAQEALTKGTMDQAKIKEQQAARHALAELQDKMPLIDEKRDEWLRASQAMLLTDAEKALTRLELDVNAMLNQQQEYEEKRILAQKELQEAQGCLADERSREKEREELAREIVQLQSIAERMILLEQSCMNVRKCAKEQSALEQIKQETAERYTELRLIMQASQEEYQKVLPLSLEENSLKCQYEQVQQTVLRRQRLAELRGQYQKMAEYHDVLATREKEKKDECSAVSFIHSEMQKRWLEGQAAVLAAELTADTPCPVCGSREHPTKAVGTGTIPTEKQLKAQRALMDKQEQECKKIAEELGRCKIERDTLANKLSDLEQMLGDAVQCPVEELERVLEECLMKLNGSREAQSRLHILEQELTHTKAQVEAYAKGVEECEERYRLAQNALKMAEAVMAERQAAIPSEYRDPSKLAKAQQSAEEKRSSLQLKLEKAQQRAEAASMQLSAGEEAYRQTAAAYETGRLRLTKEQELFIERMQKAGFLLRNEYEQAKKPAAYVQELEACIKAFDQAFAATNERVLRADEEAKELQPPDIVALQQVVNEIRVQYETALKEKTVLETTVTRHAAWVEKLAQRQAAVEKVEVDYRVIGLLADVANGRNQYGLTFQRFVLGALLDDVATAANERLKLMSRGRYYLQRTMERARKNAAGGLDLEIFDNYTGNTRGVSTLSGGETFLASLALALGLADVVQTYSGGIHLDTIFIDEGFGTLDPESLDFAMKALLDLQRDGRLVGIISHVPELRERIDARLEIKATDKGSTAHFHVG